MKVCPSCHGKGRGNKACPLCSGLGKHDCMCGDKAHTCGACDGSGVIPCPICAGRGAIRGVRSFPSLIGKNLTQTRDGEYITRHQRRDIDRNSLLIQDETGHESPFTEEEIMKYGKQKLDLEKLTKPQAQYRDKLTSILRVCRWNVTQAAKRVGLSRASMYRRLHVLSIKIPPGQRRGPSIFDHVIAGVVEK